MVMQVRADQSAHRETLDQLVTEDHQETMEKMDQMEPMASMVLLAYQVHRAQQVPLGQLDPQEEWDQRDHKETQDPPGPLGVQAPSAPRDCPADQVQSVNRVVGVPLDNLAILEAQALKVIMAFRACLVLKAVLEWLEQRVREVTLDHWALLVPLASQGTMVLLVVMVKEAFLASMEHRD